MCVLINIILLIVLCLGGLLFSDIMEEKGFNYYKAGKNDNKISKKVIKSERNISQKLTWIDGNGVKIVCT